MYIEEDDAILDQNDTDKVVVEVESSSNKTLLINMIMIGINNIDKLYATTYEGDLEMLRTGEWSESL